MTRRSSFTIAATLTGVIGAAFMLGGARMQDAGPDLRCVGLHVEPPRIQGNPTRFYRVYEDGTVRLDDVDLNDPPEWIRTEW